MAWSVSLSVILRWGVGLGVLLFASAGHLDWPAAWLFLLVGVGGGGAVAAWLAVHDPELLRERRRWLLQPGQSAIDKLILLAVVALSALWLIGMGIEAGRPGAASTPWPARALGVAGLVAAWALVHQVLRRNSFAAPVVKLQPERRHHVISTGAYAWVRHPMYSAFAIGLFAAPLILGSRWGFAGAAALTAVFAGRSVLEERVLAEGLPGYRDYQRRVRYRLVPGLW